MKTRLVIMQDLIARRKALRSKGTVVCPAKCSGQQPRALRGARAQPSTLNLQASVVGGAAQFVSPTFLDVPVSLALGMVHA